MKYILCLLTFTGLNAVADVPTGLPQVTDPLIVAADVFDQIDDLNDMDFTSNFPIFGYGDTLAEAITQEDGSLACADANATSSVYTAERLAIEYKIQAQDLIARLVKTKKVSVETQIELFKKAAAAGDQLQAFLEGKKIRQCWGANALSVTNGGELYIVKVNGEILFAYGWGMPD